MVATQTFRTRYEITPKQFGIQSATVRKIVHKWTAFKTAGSVPRSGHPSRFIHGQIVHCSRKDKKLNSCIPDRSH